MKPACLKCQCPLIVFDREKRTHCARCQHWQPETACDRCGEPMRGVLPLCERCAHGRAKRMRAGRVELVVIEGGVA